MGLRYGFGLRLGHGFGLWVWVVCVCVGWHGSNKTTTRTLDRKEEKQRIIPVHPLLFLHPLFFLHP
eukprot:scaffold879_cov170-Ochromonas_danica.AAC.16